MTMTVSQDRRVTGTLRPFTYSSKIIYDLIDEKFATYEDKKKHNND
jgi:hypothetical protein